ncbi:MAG: sugar transferase [Bacillota bacterium]
MYKHIKYFLDKVFALVALVILWPFILLCIIAIKIDSEGPAILKQERSGYKGKIFRIYKFRTMYQTNIAFDTQNPIIEARSTNVTRVGRYLRRFKLDELPQLLNIIKGEMSFVGTRPLMPCYLEEYESWELHKFDVRPGLSGYAQVCGNGHLTSKERSYYDIIYSKRYNVFWDMFIIFKTLQVVILGEDSATKIVSPKDMLNMQKSLDRDTEGKMLVAHIVGNTSLGGVSQVAYNYCKHIDKSKFITDFYTFGNGAIDEEFKKLGNLYYQPSFINFLPAMKQFYKHLKLNKYDIVHSHLTTLSFFPLLVAKLRGVKVRICHAHSTTNNSDTKNIIKRILRPFANMVATEKLACSKNSADWCFLDDANKATVINNAIELDKFSYNATCRKAIKEEYSLTGNVVGFAGRFTNQKNNAFMVDIIVELNKIKPSTLVLVGDGEDKDKILKRIKELHAEKLVVFVRQTDKMNEFYNIFDSFLMTSLYEGLPLVGIEALANGLPLILSNNITAELSNYGTVRYISLAASAKEWAQTIASLSPKRSDNLTALKLGGYDIFDQTDLLESTYLNAVSKRKKK